MKLGNFFNTTIRNFFRNTEVRQSVCAIASACSGGGGGGLSEVTTENSDSVTFTGTGTQDDPLTAEVTGGGSNTFSNGLRENNGEVKLGLELVPPFEGLITETTYLYAGNLQSGDAFGMAIDPNTKQMALSGGSPAEGYSSDISLTYASLIIARQNEGQITRMSFEPDHINIQSENDNFEGIVYNNDYSSNYVDRSLPDVGYVKSLLGSNPNVIVTGTTQELVAGTYYTNNTTQNGTWNLPIVAGSEGKRIGLINQNSGEVTVNGSIYYSGESVPSLTIMQGETYILYNNGLYWTVIA